jgi:hypothetical protein
MTENNQTEKEQRRAIVGKTLEGKLFQNTLGSNLVRSQPHEYGQLGLRSGEATYHEVTSDETFNKQRQEIYNQKKKGMEQDGVYGEPAMPSNSEISHLLMRQLREVMGMATLSELEEHTKDIGAELDFKVPEKLRKMSYEKIISGAKENGKITNEGRLDIDKLTEDEKDALGMYQVLSQAYERACARNASQANYFEDLSNTGKDIAKKYNPKKE